MITLDEIGVGEGTDKSSLRHNYLQHYERLFAPMRAEPITVIEIGVFTGASLRTWRRYFTEARIIGVDINQNCAKHGNARTEVMIGSQVDPVFLAKLPAADIIIDDGSHRADHIPVTFEHLFPKVTPGGCYVVEDLDVHSDPSAKLWRGEADRPPTDDFERIFTSVATRRRRNIDRVEAFPGGVAFWKPLANDVPARFAAIRAVLDTTGGTSESWQVYAGLLRDHHRLAEAEVAITKALKLGPEGPWVQKLADDIKARLAALAE